MLSSRPGYGVWGSIPRPSAGFGSMVKRKSCCGSNAEFWVQILVGLLLIQSWCSWCSGRCMPGCEPGGKGSTPFGYPRRPQGGTFTSVLLGEQAASKTAARGSTPRARAVCPDGVADCIGPSEGPGPGSSPGRDTHAACECAGSHGSFRHCKTRFNSSAGC